MGQKTHPNALRLGFIKDWENTWFSTKNYKSNIIEDLFIHKYLSDHFENSAVSGIRISRKADIVDISITSAKAGSILGKGGEIVSKHKLFLANKLQKKVFVTVNQEKNPEKSAVLLAKSICAQIEKRTPFRRAMKMAIQWARKAGAEGVKVMCSGRLGGLEIARSESYREGKVPLQTLRSDIDYSFAEACTTYGKIGVKVWVYNGDVLDSKDSRLSLDSSSSQSDSK